LINEVAESTFEAGYCQLIIGSKKSIFTLWFIELGEVDPLAGKVSFVILGMVFQVFCRVCNCIIDIE